MNKVKVGKDSVNIKKQEGNSFVFHSVGKYKETIWNEWNIFQSIDLRRKSNFYV